MTSSYAGAKTGKLASRSGLEAVIMPVHSPVTRG